MKSPKQTGLYSPKKTGKPVFISVSIFFIFIANRFPVKKLVVSSFGFDTK